MGNSVEKEKYLKPFSGDESSQSSEVSIDYFISNIEILLILEKWNEEEAAANACKLLTGKAFTWLENLRRESPEMVAQWSKLKPKLVARFANGKGGNNN